uniref:Tr-type G domain-containing protein n=1 Tax=Rhabditophanes sp. KR3021 TaxID=114890 RepID=A0AC35UHQ5_9BILA
MSNNSGDDRQNNGPRYNPNAQPFIPNANATTFVPGQGFGGAPRQQPGFVDPNRYHQQHNMPQNFGSHQDYRQNNAFHGGYQMPPPVQAPFVLPQQPSNVAPIVVQAIVSNIPAKSAPVEVAVPVQEAAVVPAETEEVTVKKDMEKEKAKKDAEIAALQSKFKRAIYLDDKSKKQTVNIVFIGHVDAGKSTIGGQLMYLTGMVDKRTLEKYEKEAKDKGRESWYLSWALDTNEEEREKGKTVECGRAFFETERNHFTILDAPGHKSFVPNMITGATQADVAVLVISARKGEFETGFDRGGQTREHAMLVKTAGVKRLIILVNKMDDMTVDWAESRFNEIQGKLTPYLKKVGFNAKTDITYIPVSGLTGAFMKERCQSPKASWYKGPCFLEFIDDLDEIKRDYNGPARCLIVEKYTDMGTIVMGKMESGVIDKGQTMVLMPNKQTVQILQCWSDDIETDKVVSGNNVKLKLKGVEESDVQAGFVICSPDSLCKTGKIFDAEVFILELKSIITSGYSCVLHIHSASEVVGVKNVICTIDKKDGTKVAARFVKQEEKAIIRFEAAELFCMEPFKEFPQLGRFTLRDEGKTIAIGKIVKVVE